MGDDEVERPQETLSALRSGVDMASELPLEVCEYLLGLLGAPDLLACSGVSRSWRGRANSNRLWKLLCAQRNWSDDITKKPSTAHYFTDPKFEGRPGSDLEPLCKWRNVYNLHSGLTRNWTMQGYVRFNLTRNSSPVYCLDCDGSTVATGHENGEVVIWQVKSVPCEIQTLKCILSDRPVMSVKTTTQFVLAVQKKLLQIFKYSDGYVLLDAKSFELGDDNIEVMGKLPQLGGTFTSWYEECVRFNDFNTSRKLLFVSLEGFLYANSTGSSVIYVWNLSDGKKDSVIMVTDEREIGDILVYGAYLYITVAAGDSTSILEYDPSTRLLKNMLSVNNQKKLLVSESFFLGIPSTGDSRLVKLRVWSRKTQNLVGLRPVRSGHLTAVVSDTDLVIYSENADVTVWDPKKNEKLMEFTTGGTVGFMRIGYSNFLLVFMNASLHVWDWKHGHPLYRLYSSLEWTGDYRDLVWISDTKIIAGGVKNQPEMIVFL